MKEQRFTLRVERALRELAGLPWESDAFQYIRCCETCPVVACALARGLGDIYLDYEDAVPLGDAMGWTSDEVSAVVWAADVPMHGLRPRLLALLRGEA